MRMTAEVRWQLVLARRFLRRAVERSYDHGPIAAVETVIAAQDGLELLLWAIVQQGGTTPKKAQPNFETLVSAAIDSCSKVRVFAPEMRVLNGLRNAAKHAGVPPSEDEARKRARQAMQAALDLANELPLETDLSTLSSTTGFRHRLLAEALEQAERLLDTEEKTEGETCQRRMALAHSYLRIELASMGASSSEVESAIFYRHDGTSDRNLRADLKSVAQRADVLFKSAFTRITELGFGVSTEDAGLWERSLPKLRWMPDGPRYEPTPPIDARTRRLVFGRLLALEERPGRFVRGGPRSVVIQDRCDAKHDGHIVCELHAGDMVNTAFHRVDSDSEERPIEVLGLRCLIPSTTVKDPAALGREPE